MISDLTADPNHGLSATRSALMDAALHEFSAFGYRRASMEDVARRAGVSRATLYLYWKGKEALFCALVTRLHDEHLEAMCAAAASEQGDLEQRVLSVLSARFGRFVELTSGSPHAVELYDRHGRLCGDVARASQRRSERLLARMVRDAAAAGELDLEQVGLSAPRVAGVLFDAAHGAKGEAPSAITPGEYRQRLRRVVKVLMTGLVSRS